MKTKPHILIASKKDAAMQALTNLLLNETIESVIVSSASEVLAEALKLTPEIILLDSFNKESYCLELCFNIKSVSRLKNSSVIILSEKKDEYYEVAAFNAGADDFVLKPFQPMALVKRIKAHLPKSSSSISIQKEADNSSRLKIDRESYSVFLGNDLLQVTRKEFELLYLMAGNPGKVFRREEIYQNVWNKKLPDNDRSIDVHILRLRRKLGDQFIYTQKGVGYRFMI